MARVSQLMCGLIFCRFRARSQLSKCFLIIVDCISPLPYSTAMLHGLAAPEYDLDVKYNLLRVGFAPHEMSSVTKACLRKRKSEVQLILHPDKNCGDEQRSTPYFQEFMRNIDWLLGHSQVPEELPMSANLAPGHAYPESSQGSSTSAPVARADVNVMSGETQRTPWVCGCGLPGCTVYVDMARDVEFAKMHKGRRFPFRSDALVISCNTRGCEARIFTRHTQCHPEGWKVMGNRNFYCISCNQPHVPEASVKFP